MAVTVENAVPFGRSLEVYRLIFDLSDADFKKNTISVADGPSSFNSEMSKSGRHVTSIVPIYEYPGRDIGKRFYEVLDGIMDQVRASPDDYIWTYYKSLDDLRFQRIEAMEIFLADYKSGQKEGRYIIGSLPKLSYADNEFDLALCSHFLFLYSEHFDYEFHKDSVYEMLRVAGEARIFPLVDLKLILSPYVDPLRLELEIDGYIVEIKEVDYEFQRGGNEMMRISRP